MKILFINFPYYGHVVPTIGLVEALTDRGHEVSYLLPFDWKDKVVGSGAEFVGYENHKRLDNQIINAFLTAEEIIENFDLVIYEQFFFLGKHLSEKHFKPAIRIFTAPATNAQLMREYISAKGHLNIFQNKLLCRLWTKKITRNLGIKLDVDCWLDEIVNHEPEMNFVYTTKAFQPYVDSFPEHKYHFLGASVYERKEETDNFPTLNINYPVVYIYLGTIVKGKNKFYKICIDALKDEKINVVMSVGKDFNINKLGVLPENFYIRDFVPQMSVLKKSDVFVTHGGMNSLSEAMVLGIPMIVIPLMSDQPSNAKQVERLGLGKGLDYSSIMPELLRKGIFEVIND